MIEASEPVHSVPNIVAPDSPRRPLPTKTIPIPTGKNEKQVDLEERSREHKLLLTQSCPEASWIEEDADEDCCCICLETFSEENPAKATKCGHSYHLQCIMQWHQRSTLCPMCTCELELADPTAQEILSCMQRQPQAETRTQSNANTNTASSTNNRGAATYPRRFRIVHSDYPLGTRTTWTIRDSSQLQTTTTETSNTDNNSSSRRGSLSALRANFRKWIRSRSGTA